MNEQPTISLTPGNVPLVTVGDRPATSEEMLAHILASQLRTETMVRDVVSKVGPTMENLSKHPLLSKMFS